MPCFSLCQIITVCTQLDTNTYKNLSTFATPRSHDYLNQTTPQSLRDLTSSAHLYKAFRMTLYFRLRDSLPICAEDLTDPWLGWVSAANPVNESINSTQNGLCLNMLCLSLWLFSFSLGLCMPRCLGHSQAMPLRLSNCASNFPQTS